MENMVIGESFNHVLSLVAVGNGFDTGNVMSLIHNLGGKTVFGKDGAGTSRIATKTHVLVG